MTTRRSFLASILAAGVAPMAVKAGVLMPVYTPKRLVLWGDGIHDDTAALQALIDGKDVTSLNGARWVDEALVLVGGVYQISKTIVLPQSDVIVRGAHFHGAVGLNAPLLSFTGPQR